MSTIHLVDPAAREAVAQIPAFDPATQSIAEFRDFLPRVFGPLEDRLVGEERRIPGPAGAPDVRVLLYRPAIATTAAQPAIVQVHGGGMIAGSADYGDASNQALADDAGAVVVAVDYRLPPETPFPGPVEDIAASLDWVHANAATLAIDPARIAIMGESAGGGLAAAAALLVRDRGGPALAAQLLVYPMLDPRTGTLDAAIDNPTTGEFLWTRAANRCGWDALRGTAPIPPERLGHFAPALATDLAGLPPTFIGTGALDLFLEEDVAYALRLSRAGVPVELHVYPGAVHGFNVVPSVLADRFAADLRAALDRFLYPPVDAGPVKA